MNYTQEIICPHCNSPIKLSFMILEDGTLRVVTIDEHQNFSTIAQLETCGIELGIVIEDN